MKRTSEFRRFVIRMYMENSDERLLYGQNRIDSDTFIRNNRWWLKKLYRETDKGAVI